MFVGAWRLFNWALVSTPFLLVGWVAFSARVLSFETAEPVEPAGFEHTIESWAPFVRAARQVDPTAPPATRIQALQKAFEAIPEPPLPVPPISVGALCNSDLRQPIYTAQIHIGHETIRILESPEPKPSKALGELISGLMTLVQSLRTSDVIALVEANRRLTELQRLLPALVKHLRDEDLRELSLRIIKLEVRRRSYTEILKADVALFNAAFGGRAGPETERALSLLQEGFRAMKRGGSVQEHASQALRLRSMALRERLWSTFMMWQAAKNHEERNQRLALQILQMVRAEEIARQGLRIEEVPNRGLPATIVRARASAP
jgi:hypothetical protein